MKKLLDKFFYPKSVALVGATEKPEKIGYTVLRNLLENGYGGSVYPVNPKYRKLQGKKCYGHLRDLPKAPDLVIFALPAALIPPQMAACREIGAQCAVVIASGFKEAGEEGEQLYRDLKFEAANNGVRLIGPNCIGLLTPAIGLNASFAPAMPAAGRVAFISQSGALGSAILDWAAEKNVKFFKHESCGKCSPCREGTFWLTSVYRKLREGYGTKKDVELIETIINQMEGNCFCLLGEFVVPGVRTSLELFRHEYEELASEENEADQPQKDLIHTFF